MALRFDGLYVNFEQADTKMTIFKLAIILLGLIILSSCVMYEDLHNILSSGVMYGDLHNM